MGDTLSNEDGCDVKDELLRSESKDKEPQAFKTPLPQRVKKLNRRGFHLLSKASEIVSDHLEKENEGVAEGFSKESDKKITSEEWKKKQEAKPSASNHKERTPGERGHENQLKKLYIQKKRAKDNEDVYDAKNSSNRPKKHKPITWP